MSKFLAGVCCGVVIVLGFIHISYLKRNREAQPEEE